MIYWSFVDVKTGSWLISEIERFVFFSFNCEKHHQKSLRISFLEINFILCTQTYKKKNKSDQIFSDCTWWPVDHSWIFPPTCKGGDCTTPGLPIGWCKSLMSPCHGISPSVLPPVFSCWPSSGKKWITPVTVQGVFGFCHG